MRVTKYRALYLGACIWAICLTLFSYLAMIAFAEARYDGPVALVAYLVVFPSQAILEPILRVVLVGDKLCYLLLWPLSACVINTAIALLIAFVVAGLRDRRRTQPVDEANRLGDERQGWIRCLLPLHSFAHLGRSAERRNKDLEVLESMREWEIGIA